MGPQLKYAAQSAAARQAQIKTFYCPSRRGAGEFSTAETFDSADAAMPPPWNSSGSQYRFSRRQQPGRVADRLRGQRRRLPGGTNNNAAGEWFNINANGVMIIASDDTGAREPD